MMKVVVIGLDGGTFDLILPWIEEGRLPHFKKILSRASSGDLDAGASPQTGICWSTFITGCNLGKHGIYDFYVMDTTGSHNRPKPVSISHRDMPSLWSIISRQNKKVAVFNVPMTYPPEEVNGIMASGFQSPPGSNDFTYPLALRKELDQVSGAYSIYPEGVSPETDLIGYLDAALAVTDKQFKAIDHFLAKGDWDLLMYVFQQTDILQHFYWHFMDTTHPLSKEDARLKNAIREMYEKVDEHLGEVLERLGEDRCLIMMSDHGVGPGYRRFWLNNWLMKEGYLKLKGGFSGFIKQQLFKMDIAEADLFNFFLKDSFIGKIRTFFTGKEVQRKNRFFYKFSDIDWSKTKAYCTAYNQLSINLKGREPEGVVSPGDEYQALRDELITKLKAVISPLTDKPMMTEIYKKEDIYWGHQLQSLPDIIYVCDDFKTRSLGGYKIGSSKIMDTSPYLSGHHRRNGMLILYGEPFKPEFKVEGAKLTDLAPTILFLLGLEIPRDMDGRILKEAFARPEAMCEKYSQDRSEVKAGLKKEHTDEAAQQIEEKLRSLGYLD
ncbi:alkaline phosphatase family protein [Candidatus Omnitrophota bacterium]